jgi:hypothetical protein
MRFAQTIAVFLCASTLALAAAGCGGGSSKSYSGAKPDAWAKTVCGALSDWAQGLQADSQKLGSDLSGATNINAVKTRFVSFLQGAETSTGTMVTKIKGVGPPAIKDGAAIQGQLVDGLEEATASFTRAVARAKKLSTTDPQAFSTGVRTLGSDVEKELTATGEKFNSLGDRYDDKSLNEATSKEPACSQISGA